MAAYSTEESEIQAVVATAAASTSTNPWGPIGKKLADHARLPSITAAGERGRARAIGIQDSTVVDRALGSPGMLKPLGVHGFVLLKATVERTTANLDVVLGKVRAAISTAPYIETAVIFTHDHDYYPAYILSTGTEAGRNLCAAYRNATCVDDLQKAATGNPAPTAGPWQLLYRDIVVDGDHVTVIVDDDDALRHLAPGDGVALVGGEDAEHPKALGRVHSYYRVDDLMHVVLDRYQNMPEDRDDVADENKDDQAAGQQGPDELPLL